jgi:PAS domain S-box-containing protein
MSGVVQTGLFTLFPLGLLALASGISAWKIHETREYRLLLLVAVLVFMLSHQMLELRDFVLTGTAAGGFPEWLETSANALASVAVYYGTAVFERERQLKTALAESEHRYRTLTEESPLPVLVTQGDTIRYANEAMAELVAAGTSEKLAGRPLPELFDADDKQSIADTVAAIADDQSQRTFVERRLVGFDGGERTVFVSGGRTTYDDEPAVHLVFRDVTREREIQRELERTRGRLETTFESSNDAILLIDPEDDRIIDANPRAAAMLGYDREELAGLSPLDIHPHEASTFEQFIDRVRQEGRLLTDELSCMRKDGVTFPAEVSASLTTIDGDECILAAIRNISDRRREQKQADVLGRVLRHNLRNDMTVVIGQAGIIDSRTTDERIAESAKQIRNTASELVELSDRVRNLRSTIQSGIHEDRTAELAPVVDEVVAEARESYPDAELSADVPKGMTVQGGDEKLLGWALSNLVENAVQHSDSDPPRACISVAESESRRGDWLVVRVADEGPEIPERARRAATDPTEQTELSHATGLGLWIVGHIADTHDGYVSFDRREGTGNVVSLHLQGTVERETESEPPRQCTRMP